MPFLNISDYEYSHEPRHRHHIQGICIVSPYIRCTSVLPRCQEPHSSRIGCTGSALRTLHSTSPLICQSFVSSHTCLHAGAGVVHHRSRRTCKEASPYAASTSNVDEGSEFSTWHQLRLGTNGPATTKPGILPSQNGQWHRPCFRSVEAKMVTEYSPSM